MINDIIYLLVIGIGIYIYITLNKKLKRDYSKKDVSYPVGMAFFIPLILPKNYFKKNKVLVAWITVLFSFASLFITIYFFGKLVGLI